MIDWDAIKIVYFWHRAREYPFKVEIRFTELSLLEAVISSKDIIFTKTSGENDIQSSFIALSKICRKWINDNAQINPPCFGDEYI